MRQIRGGKGEVVLRYFEPWPIPPRRDGITRLSRRVKIDQYFNEIQTSLAVTFGTNFQTIKTLCYL
jgi:hypothetical protein